MALSIEFGTYESEEKPNEYAETVQALADKDDPFASVTVTVNAKDASKEQFAFQRAANAIKKTARLRLKDESDVRAGEPDEEGKPTVEGTVKLTFTLTKMHKGRRSKGDTEHNDDENSEHEGAEVTIPPANAENSDTVNDENTDEVNDDPTVPANSRSRRR